MYRICSVHVYSASLEIASGHQPAVAVQHLRAHGPLRGSHAPEGPRPPGCRGHPRERAHRAPLRDALAGLRGAHPAAELGPHGEEPEGHGPGDPTGPSALDLLRAENSAELLVLTHDDEVFEMDVPSGPIHGVC